MTKTITIAEMKKAFTKEQLKAIKEQAHREAVLLADAEVKGLNEDQLRAALAQTMVRNWELTRQRDLVKNAFYAAQSEKLPVADSLRIDDIENDFEDDSTDQKIRDFLEWQLENKEITQEVFDRMIKNLEQSSEDDFLSSSQGKQEKAPKVPKKELVSKTIEYPLNGQKCPICGSELVHLGWKSRIKIEYTPAQIRYVEEKLETGVCPHKCDDQYNKPIILTVEPAEPSLLEKSMATESLISGLVYEKFLMGTPLYRLESHFKRGDVPLSRQTMSHMVLDTYDEYLKLLYEKMCQDFSHAPIVHLDETTIQCLELQENHKLSAMVVGTTGSHVENQITIYKFFEGKSQKFVSEMLGENYEGVLMSDGLKAYANYASNSPQTIKLSCMAHARRYFYQALTSREDWKNYLKLLKTLGKEGKDKEFIRAQATQYLNDHEAMNLLLSIMRQFGALYRVERMACAESEDEVRTLREEISRPIFEELVSLVLKALEGFSATPAVQKAALYFLERQESLGRYLENGSWPIDNNKCERAVKSFILPRKNFLFANTQRGAESAGGYLSLLKTAEENGLKPQDYLEYALKQLKIYKHDHGKIDEEIVEKVMPYSKELPSYLYKR